MATVVLALELISVFVLTLAVLHQYGNWRTQHPIVTVAVFVAWYFSFLIIFIVPMDVSSVRLSAPNTGKHVRSANSDFPF